MCKKKGKTKLLTKEEMFLYTIVEKKKEKKRKHLSVVGFEPRRLLRDQMAEWSKPPDHSATLTPN